MRLRTKRNSVSIVKDYGHIELSAACIKANQTGFFALHERVHPESYDSNSNDIESRDLFFGGRKLDIACAVKDASELANKSVRTDAPADGTDGADAAAGAQD